MIGQTLGHYRIIEQIGAGGKGVVYRARDEQLERDVAIKVLPQGVLGDEVARKRFRKEALSLAKLNHPNIATIHEFASQDGLDFLVIEYISGITLDDKLARGALSVEEVLSLGLQLTEGLSAAHTQGIVHRDLKPANLRLTPDGRLKILDFGLAQFVPHGSELGLTATLTESQEVTGTMPYMAPEQLSGKPADARTDVWATGAVLYEMATGCRPFPERNGPLLINSILNQKPEQPSKLNKNISPGLERVVLKALEKNPERRYQTAREIGIALTGVKEIPTTASWRFNRSAAPSIVTIVGITVLLLTVLGGFLLVRKRSAATPPSSDLKGRKSIAVLGFKNLAGKPDEAWLSIAISEMLTTNLASGDELNLVPGETVAHAKTNLSLPDAESYARDTLNKIRDQTSADDVVLGSYLALGGANDGKVHVELRLQDVVAGKTILAVAEDGKETELPDLVSRIGTKLRDRLGIGDIAAGDLAVLKASTASNPDAIRLYSEGLAKQRAYDDRAAFDLLQKAVAADPNFALAHSALSEASFALGHHMQAMDEAKRAFNLSSNLSREDRLRIEGEYRRSIGDNAGATELYTTLFDLHPDNLEYGLLLASRQNRLGKSKEALATLDRLRRFSAPEREDPRIDLEEADADFTLSNWQGAESALRRAIDKGGQSGARLIVAEALDSLGSLSYHLGRTDEALNAWNRARDIYADVGDLNKRASVANEIADLSSDMGDLSTAAAMYREAHEIHSQVGNDMATLWDLQRMAVANMRQSHLAEALTTWQELLERSRKMGVMLMQLWSLQGIGDTRERQGDPQGARQFYQKSLDLFEEGQDSQNLSFVLINFAEFLAAQGDLAKAQSLAREYLELVKVGEDKEKTAHGLRFVSALLLTQSRLSEAKAKSEEALSISMQLGEAENVAGNKIGLANVLIEEGDLETAEKFAREGKAQFQTERFVSAQAFAQAVLARALLSGGKLSEASTEISQARALWEKSRDFHARFEIGVVSARILARTQDSAEAEKQLDALLEEAKRSGLVRYELEIGLALGEIEMASGKVAAGKDRLRSLAGEARKKGFLLVANKAELALKETKGRTS